MKNKLIILSSIIILLIGISFGSEYETEKNINTSETFLNFITIEQEQELNLETWMIDSEVWELNNNILIKEQESSLELENWMIDENIWN